MMMYKFYTHYTVCSLLEADLDAILGAIPRCIGIFVI